MSRTKRYTRAVIVMLPLASAMWILIAANGSAATHLESVNRGSRVETAITQAITIDEDGVETKTGIAPKEPEKTAAPADA